MSKQFRQQAPQRTYALIIGVTLLIMAITAGFSYGYVFPSLILFDQPLDTLNKLSTSLSLFDMGLVGWLLTLLADIVVSVALYFYFKPEPSDSVAFCEAKLLGRAANEVCDQANGSWQESFLDAKRGLLPALLKKKTFLKQQKGSLLIAGSRLIYAAILAYAISHLFHIHQLVTLAQSQSAPDLNSLATQVMHSAASFEKVFSIGLIPFGIHLCLIGYFTFNRREIPKTISFLLVLAGFSYILVHGLYQLAPSMNAFTTDLEKVLTLPMTVGELGFGIWLLIKGGKSAS